jgi:hypothetical protein
MKQLGLFILLLTRLQATGQVFGQDNFYPRNFERQVGVKMVIIETACPKCRPIQTKELTEKYLFDHNGFNIEQRGIYKGTNHGLQKFFWNSDGTVNKYQNYSTYSTASYFGTDSATYENNYGMTWDSTKLSSEVRYTYEKGKLKTISWVDGEGMPANTVITFHYDNYGRLTKEEKIDYPDKDAIELGFKPNSSEFTVLPDAKKETRMHKLFNYKSDSVFIKYFRNDKQTGTEKRVIKSGQLVYVATYNIKGELTSQTKSIYNDKGKLVEQRRFETGYDGYGDGYDFTAGDYYRFEYDQQGRLKQKTEYYKNEVFLIEYYEYY